MEPAVDDKCVRSIDVQYLHVFLSVTADTSRGYSGFTGYELHRC